LWEETLELSDDDVSEIATQVLPTDPNLPTISEAQRFLDPSLVRTRASAVRLQLELSRRTDLVPPHRAWLVTFGFIPLGTSIAHEVTNNYPKSEKFTFGVSVFSQSATNTPTPSTQRLLGNLRFDGVLFPIILTHSRFTAHSLPAVDATSTKGSCACWVNYSGSAPAPWTKGLFTARHVVEHLSVGDPVTLIPSGPSYAGTVADYGACTVDAAVIEVDPTDWPGGMSKVAAAGPYSTAMAPGLAVELEGRVTTPRATGKIVSHHPLPGYWGSMMGQRIVIDRSGRPGDSGGCVDKAPNGQTVGIYMGEIDDGAGGKQGLAQDLHQACVYLEADVYR
jgi:hypothetical protein